jgi:hypothetical protein
MTKPNLVEVQVNKNQTRNVFDFQTWIMSSKWIYFSEQPNLGLKLISWFDLSMNLFLELELKVLHKSEDLLPTMVKT